MLNTCLKLLSVLAIMIMPLAIMAETVYVIDKLLVGVHEDKTLESPIIKVLPTGTPLQVLKREGHLVYVRDAEGIKGWVDAAYLMSDMPAGQMLEKVELRNKQIESELATAQQQLAELQLKFSEMQRTATETERTGSTSNVRLLRNENEQLKQKYAAERSKVGKLQKQLLELTKQLQSGGTDKALAHELKRLQQENERLTEQLADRRAAAPSDPDNRAGDDSLGMEFTWRGMIVIFVVSLVIGLILGGYLIDYIHRKRHGGFRV
ncbi:MAG: TIGR04211 family SH3 domain-containing protein [Gammaproteobacteria bacterium]|nr:TIGR04211 family SH3 domain-containing protein [Gammaproteobacteria bacterium]